MTTDLYAKCPCGSGKKIKFCCKDIIGDIERIERMLQGEQRNAAFDKINKLLEKHPDRPALLSLKALVYLELQQSEDAAPVIDRLLELEPENSSALAMKATLLSVTGHVRDSLKLLHHALRVSDGILSQMVYRSYLSICLSLIQSGEYIAAYAHLLTLVSITRGQDRASVSMLMNVTSSERLPAIFQGLIIKDEAPENVTWKREFDVALDMYRHGDWSSAASLLDDMNARILDEPVLLLNQAILQAWTAQNAEAVKSFREYAAIRSINEEDAAEAEACAQVLEESSDTDIYELVAITKEIDDANALMEKLLSSDSVDSRPVQRDADADTPPPKGQFVFFDRALLVENDDVQLDQLPRELCSATIFGKETDRNARITVVAFKDENLPATLERVRDAASVNLTIDDESQTIGSLHKMERLFRPNFQVPPTTSMEQFQRVQRTWIAKQLTEVWPNMPLAHFGGMSAKEAVADKKMHRKVLAAIVNLEIWSDRQSFEFDFDELRAGLGLAVSPKIDPSAINIRSLSPPQLLRVELDKLTDEDLKFVFEVVSVRPNGSLLYRIGREVLSRESMKDQVDLIEVHERMADLAPTSDEQLDHLGQARDIAVGKGESPATWLVAELDLRIRRGEPDFAKRLVAEIQSRYLREPGVSQMLTDVLSKYGLMPARPGAATPSLAPEKMDEAVPAKEAPVAGGVWTPDATGSAAPAGGESGEKSKLWIPGMD